ncbi:MAG: 2-phospho-L-lactate transferase [Chloroflexi bacterium]|nr:2-phospho-L-lactate transferase [Chloroflexota bacterium]MCL5074398.1 2-phospho-L-lactate transferase [Chloroflexota bacterium]
MIVALAGGVGGAKLIYGLAACTTPENLTCIVNTADDLEICGLYVSPDLDTIMYTLAGLANPSTGWGIREDTFNALSMLRTYGQETWFALGDRDIATHLLRTQMLRTGKSLTEATQFLAQSLHVQATLLPMSDQRVATLVQTDDGWLDFQDYFVRRRGQDEVRGIRFQGIDEARLSDQAAQALERARLIVLCPSNPIVSIGPILALAGVRGMLKRSAARKVAVSPIIGGQAIRGPAARMLKGLGLEVSAYGVAQLYADFLTGFVLDEVDSAQEGRIRSLELEVLVTDTVMRDDMDRISLARKILRWSG